MINKKIVSILIICILSIIILNININKSNAQSESVLFEETIIKKIGGDGTDICFKTIKDGNEYVSLIYSNSSEINGYVNKGGEDLLVVKLDSNLNVLKENYLGAEGDDYINDIIKTKTGYIAIGSSNSVSITRNALLKEDGWIIELDNDFNIIKQITFGGTGDDEFISIKEVEDGYILMGETDSPSINGISTNGEEDVFLVKLNKELNIVKSSIIGGEKQDSFYIYSNVLNTKNGLLFTFQTESANILGLNTNGELNKCDEVIIEVDKDLNILNKKIFGGNNVDILLSSIKTERGYVFIGGTLSTDINGVNNVDGNNPKYFVIEFDNNFNLTKTKVFDLKYSIEFGLLSKTKNGYRLLGMGYSLDTNGEIDGVGLLTLNFDSEFNLINEKFSPTLSSINQEMIMYYSFLLNEGEDILNGLNYMDEVYALIKKVRYLYKNSQSVGLEIVADNSLEMSISTNKISFEGYNGVEDLNNDKLNLTVSSGLYYDLYATLDSEIRGTNDTNAIIDKANLKIKTSDDLDYKSFNKIGEKVNIVANHKNGRDFLHNINLKLLKDSSVKADTYNTNITFEVVQK